MRFFDIYFSECDLLETEKKAYLESGAELIRKA
jgi:hypothetical protein